MSSNDRSFKEVIIDSAFGAFLGAISLGGIFWYAGVNQHYIAMGALFGLITGAIFGKHAIKVLKEAFDWSM